MKPQEIVTLMIDRDPFSQWLGIEVKEVRPNYCLLEMNIRPEMLNGLGTVHGGVTFAFADSALAFSGNNSGQAAVALNCVINFTKAVHNGDTLTAESTLLTDTRKTAVYDIIIRNQNSDLCASFRGTVYKIGKAVTDL